MCMMLKVKRSLRIQTTSKALRKAPLRALGARRLRLRPTPPHRPHLACRPLKPRKKIRPPGGKRGAGKQYGVIVKMLDKKSEYNTTSWLWLWLYFFSGDLVMVDKNALNLRVVVCPPPPPPQSSGLLPHAAGGWTGGAFAKSTAFTASSMSLSAFGTAPGTGGDAWPFWIIG